MFIRAASPPPKTCPVTGKHSYPTASKALSAAQALKRRGYTQKPYRCTCCHAWHTTHLIRELSPKQQVRIRPPRFITT